MNKFAVVAVLLMESTAAVKHKRWVWQEDAKFTAMPTPISAAKTQNFANINCNENCCPCEACCGCPCQSGGAGSPMEKAM